MNSAMPIAAVLVQELRQFGTAELGSRALEIAKPAHSSGRRSPKVKGSLLAASARATTPGTPKTFAISCGSAATAVVP